MTSPLVFTLSIILITLYVNIKYICITCIYMCIFPKILFLMLAIMAACNVIFLCDVTAFCYLELRLKLKHFYCSISETKKHPHAFISVSDTCHKHIQTTPSLTRTLQKHPQYSPRVTHWPVTILLRQRRATWWHTQSLLFPSDPQPHQYLDFLKLVETRQGALVS